MSAPPLPVDPGSTEARTASAEGDCRLRFRRDVHATKRRAWQQAGRLHDLRHLVLPFDGHDVHAADTFYLASLLDQGQQVLELLRSIVDHEGTTVLMATHDLTVDLFADRVYHLEDGHVALPGEEG